jgi:hypothetical protein
MTNNPSILLSAANMAPIEQAHLLRGFSAKKTPLKWIRFFRLCVLQREKAQNKTRKKQGFVFLCFTVSIILTLLFFIDFFWQIAIPSLIIMIVGLYGFQREFKKKYSDGYDFFASYFSALFTLMEDEMAENEVISLKANVKETFSKEFLKSKEEPEPISPLSRRKIIIEFYEKEICSGTCLLKDGSEAVFSFIETTRKRTAKTTSRSGKRTKTKKKYKSVYPFILKMKFSKSTYALMPGVNFGDLQMEEDEGFYYLRAKRKFDIKEEKPEDYSPYTYNSIQLFSVDYFTLEVMNLLNLCYGCFTLKPNS